MFTLDEAWRTFQAINVDAQIQTQKRLARTGRGWQWVVGNRRRVATIAAAGLAVSLGYHVVFGQNGLTAYQHKRQNSVALDSELGRLTRENDTLKSHVERLEHDPSAIEHQAREELHYARPGEVIYSVNAKSHFADAP